jgi:hypothetical protein
MRSSVVLVALTALAACDGTSDVDTNGLDDIRTIDHGDVTSEFTDDGAAVAVLDIDVADGDTSFLVNAFGDDALYLDRVLDPQGNVALTWTDWQGDESLTNAFIAECTSERCNRDVAFNWPIREVDGELSPGTWQVYIGTSEFDHDYYYPTDGSTVSATTVIKRDPDLGASVVPVRIVYASGVSDDPAVVAGIEGSVEVWREIWAGFGLTLQETYDDVDVTPNLDYPSSDNDAIAEATADSAPGELTVIIGEDIGASDFWLGYAGGIPGALVPGPRSGVIVGWLACAGTDGEFSASDMRIAGGTMAHEVGHFQGMFHPNETDFATYDALDDTSECQNRQACENQNGNNLMYPVTVNDIGPQEDLTDQQVGVMMRYVGSP